MDMYGLGKLLADREITTVALAKEIGVDRQKLDYWLANNSKVYAWVDRKSGKVMKITANPETKVLYERGDDETTHNISRH